MIPAAVPSAIAIVVTTDNHRTAFAVNSSKPAIMVAVPKPHIDILCERGDCNAQSHNCRNNKKTATFINAAPRGKFQRLPGEVCAGFARGILLVHDGLGQSVGNAENRAPIKPDFKNREAAPSVRRGLKYRVGARTGNTPKE